MYVCMYVCIYIYIYIYVCVYIYTYTHYIKDIDIQMRAFEERAQIAVSHHFVTEHHVALPYPTDGTGIPDPNPRNLANWYF